MLSPVSRLFVAAVTACAATAPGQPCEGGVDRSSLIPCLLAHNPALKVEAANVRVGEARREAARPFLPSNPTVTATLASRHNQTQRDTNWTVTLAQEFELAGQSVLRTDAAEHELRARRFQLEVVRAELCQAAWTAWFRVLAARRQLALARRIEAAVTEVARTATGMAAQGLLSDAERAVAEAAAVRERGARLAQQRSLAQAEADLFTLVATTARDGELEPLDAPPLEQTRPEARALDALRAASTGHLAVLQRSRVPRLTLSLFAQNDGFQEKVYGGGVSLPVPLPQPVGRTLKGEVAEALALEDRAQAELERLTLQLTAERTEARVQLQTTAEEAALYPARRRESALASLEAISAQVAAARLGVRDAVVLQEALVNLLRADVEARLAWCLASVRWQRVTGGLP